MSKKFDAMFFLTSQLLETLLWLTAACSQHLEIFSPYRGKWLQVWLPKPQSQGGEKLPSPHSPIPENIPFLLL